MTLQRTLIGTLAVALLATITVGLGHAQGPDPGGTLRPEAAVGAGFTYQGRLTDGDAPADGAYDLAFALYDSPDGDGQVGSTVTLGDVAVSEGLFTVQLDFGSDAFNGDARYLEVRVRPGESSGGYTTLSPRQALTAAPYALYALETAPHDHWGDSWSGSGTGLSLDTSDGTGLLIDAAGAHGVRVGSAGGAGLRVDSAAMNGVYVASADDDGVDVDSAKDDGLDVDSAGRHGLYVGSASADGVHVDEAGDPSTAGSSSSHDGVEVRGAEGNGLYVGRADEDGVHVSSAGAEGVHVSSADGDGVKVGEAGDPSTTGSSISHNGVEVQGAEGHGLYVGQADGDGVHVHRAGDPSTTYPSTSHNGVEVEGAEGDGVYVGQADVGVHVHTATNEGVRVRSAGYGVAVDSARYDGVHVSSADGRAGYFGGDVEVTGELQVNGPAVGFFPRPAYNSGWVDISKGEDETLTHNVGGDASDYFVDLQCREPGGRGIHVRGYGMYEWASGGAWEGVFYQNLTSSTVQVWRESNDTECDQIRIRIWRIQ